MKDENEYISVESVWPTSISDVTVADLRNLDETEFEELLHRFSNRLASHGFSKDAVKRQRRKLLKKRRKQKYSPTPKHLLFHDIRNSRILESFVPDRQRIWVKPSKRSLSARIHLHNFSLIDSPIETLKQLVQFGHSECNTQSTEVDFEDSQMLDIGPYLIWGLMRQDMIPFMRGGRMSASIQKVVDIVGLRSFMRMGRFREDHGKDDIWGFPLRS